MTTPPAVGCVLCVCIVCCVRMAAADPRGRSDRTERTDASRRHRRDRRHVLPPLTAATRLRSRACGGEAGLCQRGAPGHSVWCGGRSRLVVDASALPCQCLPQSRVDLLRGLLLHPALDCATAVAAQHHRRVAHGRRAARRTGRRLRVPRPSLRLSGQPRGRLGRPGRRRGQYGLGAPAHQGARASARTSTGSSTSRRAAARPECFG